MKVYTARFVDEGSAAKFATVIGREYLIGISAVSSFATIGYIVWYWGNP